MIGARVLHRRRTDAHGFGVARATLLATENIARSFRIAARFKAAKRARPIDYQEEVPVQPTDGDATPTSRTNQSSLPSQPELIHLSAVEHLLHNAAQRRGQGEGAAQAAAALTKAAAHYKAEGAPEKVEQVLKQLATQFGMQATQCQQQQNVMLGQWIVARRVSDEPSDGVAPRRVGWAVRAWRATVARVWDWAFAK